MSVATFGEVLVRESQGAHELAFPDCIVKRQIAAKGIFDRGQPIFERTLKHNCHL